MAAYSLLVILRRGTYVENVPHCTRITLPAQVVHATYATPLCKVKPEHALARVPHAESVVRTLANTTALHQHCIFLLALCF